MCLLSFLSIICLKQVKEEKVNKNIISLDESKNIIWENYKWYYYHPSLDINHNYIIYQTFLSDNFTNEIIKSIFGLELPHCEKIIEYYKTIAFFVD